MDQSRILEEVADIIRDVLENDDKQLKIDAATTADQTEGSFNHINIVVAIEQHFGMKFKTAEIEKSSQRRGTGGADRSQKGGVTNGCFLILTVSYCGFCRYR